MAERQNIPVLDHGYVRLVETWGSDQTIIESARMSTGKSFLGWGPLCKECVSKNEPPSSLSGTGHTCTQCGTRSEDTMYKGDERLLRRLYTKRHTSPFEFAGATLEVQAPIAVFREWHRHRTQSYSEMSARYAPLPDMNYVPTVSRLLLNQGTKNRQEMALEGSEFLTKEASEDWIDQLISGYETCENIYQSGLRKGVPKELARMILPVGRYSRMRATANLHNWIRFLTLRLPNDAQWEIRSYAAVAAELIGDHCPRSMALFGEELIR
jgi:thymidylate synthase (FAD)